MFRGPQNNMTGTYSSGRVTGVRVCKQKEPTLKGLVCHQDKGSIVGFTASVWIFVEQVLYLGS